MFFPDFLILDGTPVLNVLMLFYTYQIIGFGQLSVQISVFIIVCLVPFERFCTFSQIILHLADALIQSNLR